MVWSLVLGVQVPVSWCRLQILEFYVRRVYTFASSPRRIEQANGISA